MRKELIKFNSKILVVDDYDINLELISEMLKILGCSVDKATTGEKAISLCSENSYDLIFMDISMPGMDGCEATRKIRENQKFITIPIIALTASTWDSDKKKYFESGMNDFLSKPIQLKDVESMLIKYLKTQV